MANTAELYEKIMEDGEFFMYDSYLECAIKRKRNGKCYLKHKGRKEKIVQYSNDTFCQIEMGGEFISKEEYEKY